LEKALKATRTNKDCLAEPSHRLGHLGSGRIANFRTQTSMTLGTLLLENALRAFMSALLGKPANDGEAWELVLHLLFDAAEADGDEFQVV